MPTREASPSLVIALLRIIRDANAGVQGLTREDLLEKVVRSRYSYLIDEPDRYYWPYLLDEMPYDDQLRLMDEFLGSLADLGLIAQSHESNQMGEFKSWRIADSWRPPRPPDGGGGGDGGNDNILGAGAPGDDDEGGGLRETLGHPVLFALPTDEFDDLTAGLFEERFE